MATFKSAGIPMGYQMPRPASTTTGSPLRSVYDAAATKQSQDYDDIMAGYDSLQSRAAGGSGTSRINFVPVSSTAMKSMPGYAYNRSADMGRLVGDLQNFSTTGGYSDADIGAIRERGLSPLRSVYANALRNVNRQKVLQGGYSPNHGAVTAKMAREQGELLSSASTNVNAKIAEMVQAGKLAGFQQLNPLLSQENTLMNNIGLRNSDAERETALWNANEEARVRDLNASMKMRADEFNANADKDDFSTELAALQGKTSLYGTTPALTNLFGDQVLANNAQNMQAVQTANAIKQNRANTGLNLMSQVYNSPIRLG